MFIDMFGEVPNRCCNPGFPESRISTDNCVCNEDNCQLFKYTVENQFDVDDHGISFDYSICGDCMESNNLNRLTSKCNNDCAECLTVSKQIVDSCPKRVIQEYTSECDKLEKEIKYLEKVNDVNHELYCWTEEYSICEHTGDAIRYPITCVLCDGKYHDGCKNYDLKLTIPKFNKHKCCCSYCSIKESYYTDHIDHIDHCIFCCDDIVDGKEVKSNCFEQGCNECIKYRNNLIKQIKKKHKKSNHVCDHCEYKRSI